MIWAPPPLVGTQPAHLRLFGDRVTRTAVRLSRFVAVFGCGRGALSRPSEICAPPPFLIPGAPPGPRVHRWNETTVLPSDFVHGEVTPLLVTRKRTEWYISSLSSPQASESGRALAADSYCVVVLLKVMV